MPMIELKLIEGAFDAAQKRQIVEALTDTIVDIKGEQVRPSTLVFVEDVERANWRARGTTTISMRAVKLMATGARVA
jgi:4-oxalocrotonate tautomerase